jgi:CD2 antigen cytoplasmic tail-binding protein 2
MPPSRRNDQPGPSETKRTRFASPPPPRDRSTSVDGPDEFLEEDLQQGAGRAKQKSKRQIQDTEGYKSDSSNDDEGIVPSRRPKEEEEEDVDMFGEVEEKKDKGKEKKKDFMDMDDIEGQEFDKRKDGMSEDESDSDAEIAGDEVTERKKRKEKALGYEVTGFNMKEEMEEGKFTADGETYVENAKDEGDKHDVWLTDMDKDAIKKARRAHKEREKQEAEREEAEAKGVGKEREHELMQAAVDLMERGETVLEAVQRLGKEAEDKRKKEDQGKKKSWAERQKERKALMAQNDAE